ncbi:MAG: hypothetical protein GOMPHAMPRED_001941 [Gomphillus americanus]|uniref:Uncharacterized protein n=1 Tax=Gomphillus americanus TaxID=1940652 RepID=A0A8H3FDD3_9LECA|nr:MAG: hypothetical protein GOMPHAMPRED_001941 [Gomphillus americanus]
MPPSESRTRKARPPPINPQLELPPTLQIGKSTPKAHTAISSHFSDRTADEHSLLHPHRGSTTPSSSPRLHFNIRSAPTTPRVDLFKPLPAIKIESCCVPQRKPITPPAAPSPSPSPDFLQASSSPPPSLISSSPPTPSILPLSISISPSTPSPKYGDAIFHTLPEEAYPLITAVSRKPSGTQQPNFFPASESQQAMIEDHERPFWRAAIQPVIDPRSGMNYYTGSQREVKVVCV